LTTGASAKIANKNAGLWFTCIIALSLQTLQSSCEESRSPVISDS
jgi:hypothetical protein